jgi:hypothetical protein
VMKAYIFILHIFQLMAVGFIQLKMSLNISSQLLMDAFTYLDRITSNLYLTNYGKKNV